MTFLNRPRVSYADTAQLDAFGRLRVSNPLLLIDEKNVSSSPAVGNFASGTGSYSKPANRSSHYLTVATGVGLARRQTRQRAVYQPGKSQSISMTFTAAVTSDANVTQRIGYFDSLNGIFLRLVGNVPSFVVRSSISGSPVDTVIARAAWDDPMDGTGPSGITLDWSKSQILGMDFQWLGVGRIRFGFSVNGQFIVCASHLHANVNAGVHMAVPNQPLRWEIESAGSFTGPLTLEAICGQVTAEGGFEQRGLVIGHNNNAAARPVNGALASGEILAVRLNAAGLVSGGSKCLGGSVFSPTTANFLWELWLNPTVISVAGTWASPTASLTEQSVDRTITYAGGVKLAAGVGNGSAGGFIPASLPAGLGYDINAAAADVLSLRIINISGNNDYYGALNFQQEA